eukprot:COSAG01_NODE_8443_length_2783_cov_3.987705_4_plen_53_part_00
MYFQPWATNRDTFRTVTASSPTCFSAEEMNYYLECMMELNFIMVAEDKIYII